MRRWLPWWLALGAALVTGALAWSVVAADAAEWQAAGYTIGPEVRLVGMLGLLAGGITWFVARRVVRGPAIRLSDEWMLSYPAPANEPRLGELVERLERLGYALQVTRLDEAAVPQGEASPSQPLAGGFVRIGERRRPFPRAGVFLRMSPADRDERVGLLEVADVSGPIYDELAQYVIAALGELLPGLTFQRPGSELGPDSADELRGQLPRRPARLAG
jgi:hypothetical protein